MKKPALQRWLTRLTDLYKLSVVSSDAGSDSGGGIGVSFGVSTGIA